MNLKDRLDAIDSQIAALKEDRRKTIANEPATFQYLDHDELTQGFYSTTRYVQIFADGTLVSRWGARFSQRPAALRTARDGRYIYDARERVVLNSDGEAVHTPTVKEPA